MSAAAFTIVVVLLVAGGALVGFSLWLQRGTATTIARVAQVVAVALAALWVLGAIIDGATTIFSDTTTLPIALSLPIPAEISSGVDLVSPVATIVGAESVTATVTITHLSWGARLLVVASEVIKALVVAYFAWLVFVLARGVRANDPFPGLARHIRRSGIVLFLSYVTVQVLDALASNQAAHQALGLVGGASYEGNNPLIEERLMKGYLPIEGWPEPADFALQFEFIPLAVALILVLLGAVFAAGEKMQHDVDGLV